MCQINQKQLIVFLDLSIQVEIPLAVGIMLLDTSLFYVYVLFMAQSLMAEYALLDTLYWTKVKKV